MTGFHPAHQAQPSESWCLHACMATLPNLRPILLLLRPSLDTRGRFPDRSSVHHKWHQTLLRCARVTYLTGVKIPAPVYTASVQKRLKINSSVPFMWPPWEGKGGELFPVLTTLSPSQTQSLCIHQVQKLRLLPSVVSVRGKQVTWGKEKQHRCLPRLTTEASPNFLWPFLVGHPKAAFTGVGRLHILCLLFSWEDSLVLKESEDGWAELNHADARKRFKVIVASQLPPRPICLSQR